MKVQLGLLCMAALGCAASNLDVSVTPVAKIAELLQGMLDKATLEKHSEAVVYAAAQQFCGHEEETKTSQIVEEREDIEFLGAAIKKDESKVQILLRNCARLGKEGEAFAAQITEASNLRTTESAEYITTHKDYSESTEALSEAIETLDKQDSDRPQADSLIQVSSLLKDKVFIPAPLTKQLEAFFQSSGQDSFQSLGAEPGVANGYEFQSSGISDMLLKLQSEFIDEKTKLEKKETNAKHSHELFLKDLEAQIKQAFKQKNLDAQAMAMTQQKEAGEKSDMQSEQSLERENEKYVKKLKEACSMEAGDFQARQELRTTEMEAIRKAMEIMSSDAVAGAAAKRLALIQKAASALPQLRSGSAENTKLVGRVSTFLQSQAERLNSRVLAAVATQVAADPFGKVTKMLKDLVSRLLEEANDEADHHGWCDTELGTNAQTRKDKSSAVDHLRANIDGLKASIAKLGQDKANIIEEMAETNSAMAEKTKLRQEQKDENDATIKDATEAQQALAQATTVLNEFYGKAARAAALIQGTAAAPYQGLQSENDGVLGMLELLTEDFARLETETKAQDSTAQLMHGKFLDECKVSLAEMETNLDHYTKKLQDDGQKLIEHNTDFEETQKQLDSALLYFDKLKPSCVDSGASYEDRVARRNAEIESLKEALTIISGDDGDESE